MNPERQALRHSELSLEIPLSGANTIKKAEDSIKDFTSLQILGILSCTASDEDPISAQHAALISTPFGAFKLLWDFLQTFLFYCETKRAFTGELVATFSGKDTDIQVVTVTTGSCLHTPSSQLSATFILWPRCTCSSESKARKAIYKLLKKGSTGLQLLRQTPIAWSSITKPCLFFCFVSSQHSKKLPKKIIICYTHLNWLHQP